MKTIPKLLLPLLLLSLSANAIIMRHDKEPQQYETSAKQYPSVVNLQFLMGTLIAPQWIVTAAHGTPLMPGGQNVRINGDTYKVEKIIVHPEYAPRNRPIETQQDHDIALLKLDRPVKNIDVTPPYSQQNEATQKVWLVGNGYIGNGRDGITGATDGLLHAQNVIDNTDDKWLTFDFDSPEHQALSLEGVSGPGDSGGPAFIRRGKQLFLAGVSSHQFDNEAGLPNVYGVTERYTRVSTHTSWIEETMTLRNEELDKVAVNRPQFTKTTANETELQALVGTYDVENLPPLTIEPCQQALCYRWQGQPNTTILQRADKDLWFTPSLNRSLDVIRNKHGEVEKLYFNGYQGNKYAIKR